MNSEQWQQFAIDANDNMVWKAGEDDEEKLEDLENQDE
jgi:hypothetical protein